MISSILKKCCLVLLPLLFVVLASINGLAIDDFHCKVPTCRDFHYGLKHLPRHEHYVDACYDTVFDLQSIPRKYGKCIDDMTAKLNAPCIHALAEIIKKCVSKLDDLPEDDAKFYCGFTLMKYCAVHVGLERYPLKLNLQTRNGNSD